MVRKGTPWLINGHDARNRNSKLNSGVRAGTLGGLQSGSCWLRNADGGHNSRNARIHARRRPATNDDDYDAGLQNADGERNKVPMHKLMALTSYQRVSSAHTLHPVRGPGGLTLECFLLQAGIRGGCVSSPCVFRPRANEGARRKKQSQRNPVLSGCILHSVKIELTVCISHAEDT